MKKLLNDKKVAIGTWLNTGSNIVAELIAQSDLDFICIDAEHSPVDINNIIGLVQAINAGNTSCYPIARIHGLDYSLTKRYLDAGIKGIICPLVNSKEQAELLVKTVYYPPTGQRGLGFCKANNYGSSVKSYFNKANEEIFVAIQIEDIKAVENLESILSVDGIDCVFIGPYDLSASMGVAGDFQHPDYINARNKILRMTKEKGLSIGIHVVQPCVQECQKFLKEGYNVIAYSLDITILTEAYKNIKLNIQN